MARTSIRQILRSHALTILKLTPGQGLVLLALADRSDAKGECWPSPERIADDLGMSRLGVRKAIAVLIEKGAVEIVEKGGPRKPTRYRISLASYLRATV